MKILALNGSLRGERGATFKLLHSIGRGVEQAGGIWNVENLSELNIESCRACNHCQITKTYKCILDAKDDVKDVFGKMMDADMIIYASPVYMFGISNLLKRLLERIHSCAPVGEILLTKSGLFFHATNRLLSGKPFVSLIVCDNVENLTVHNAKEYFRIFGRFMDAPHVAHLERRGAAAWMAALEGTANRRKRMREFLDTYVAYRRRTGIKRIHLEKLKRKAERPFIKIPFPVRMARHILPLRPLIEKEVCKRSSNISSMIGVKEE